MKDPNSVLTINGGSSSIKFAIYHTHETLHQLLSGEIESIGTTNVKFSFTKVDNQAQHISIQAENYEQAVNALVDWLQEQSFFKEIKAVGHRIVHGMKHKDAQLITPVLLEELKTISVCDPEHLPGEIKLIEIFKKRYPSFIQVACFDTSFHTSMPQVAKLLPIPRRFYDMGIQRYGFHGLSYEYLIEELKKIKGNNLLKSKVILAHLGNGASLAAVRDGKSIDTSMGFTPASGIPMSTRTGDLDPGVAWYLIQTEKLSTDQFSHLINHESGLLGVSETSSDMRELIKNQHKDVRAAEAIDMFCYQTKKYIGSFTAALGGLDELIFSGGIGAQSPEIRQRICNGLQFLGIELDEIKNQKNELVISTDNSKVPVFVIKTNEELMIAKSVCKVLNIKNN